MGGRGRWISEFEASLVYRVSSRTARAIQRNPVSKREREREREREPIETLYLLLPGVFLFVYFVVVFFKTGFLCIALAVLKLTLWTRLASNSQRSFLCLRSEVLGLKACTTTPGCFNFVCLFVCFRPFLLYILALG